MRGYNFGAGPATLPTDILKEIQTEWLDWDDLGMSVIELGHRTEPFMKLMAEAEADLRILLDIPNNYEVLFLGGASRTQFSMVPMNLIETGQQAAYIISGVWSKMAYEEAVHLRKAYICEPNIKKNDLLDNTAYLYYTPNETINGIYTKLPDLSDLLDLSNIPIVADMTSCLLSEPIDVSKYGVIFAGAQKNIAPAGLTLVIINSELLNRSHIQPLPTMLDYKTHVKNHSLYATPPTFNCYFAHKMFKWLLSNGGLKAMAQINNQKANKLYDYIDQSNLYLCQVPPESRSKINICFNLKHKDLEDKFLLEAEKNGLYALKGHRAVGGLRASLYNAMPISGVDALINFMINFENGCNEY